MNIMEKKNTDLIKEFDRYIRENPEFAEIIPHGAVVIMLLEGDEEFNKWSRQLANDYAEKGHDIMYVKIKKIRPVRSRIENLEISKVA